MTNAERAIQQAEFLSLLSNLLNKYQAEIYVDGEEYLAVTACGSEILPCRLAKSLNVDTCIAATEATINHAMAIV